MRKMEDYYEVKVAIINMIVKFLLNDWHSKLPRCRSAKVLEQVWQEILGVQVLSPSPTLHRKYNL